MDKWMFVLLPVAVLCIACAAFYAFRVRRAMAGLERMLEQALDGGFEETKYDESRLSKLEAKFARFLSASLLSRRSIDADRARIKELIGDISHQTKTPLSNILLYLELMQEKELPEDVRQMAELAGAQSGKLAFLIESLVKLSRLESGAVQVCPARHQVWELLAAIQNQYAPLAAEKWLCVTVEPCSLEACFDPKWTSEALGNLVDNAIKYTPEGGSVAISAREYELFCRIDIADSGIGVPESERANIFRRFYRAEAVREMPGVGIGLYLARQIAALEGGYIRVSDAPAGGALFSLYLPREM